jgi:hypothetical protein
MELINVILIIMVILWYVVLGTILWHRALTKKS